MARIVEDSEEEFPDLADILKSSKSTSCRKTTSISTSRESRATEAARRSAKLGGESKASNSIREGLAKDVCERKGAQAELLERETKKSKKRVLKPISDNPLLRPIASTDIRTAPSKPSGKVTGSKAGERRRVVVEKRPDPVPQAEWEEEESDFGPEYDGDSDGMSDFVVSDSESLEDDESVVETLPPRSARRLVQGKRLAKSVEEEYGELDLKMGKLKLDVKDSNMKLPPKVPAANEVMSLDERDPGIGRRKNISQDAPKAGQKSEEITDSILGLGSVLDDPAILRFSPSQNRLHKLPKEPRLKTPPPSPSHKPAGLVSPKKIQRIPLTPHRPSMDSFWSQEVINDWNDEFSPRKLPTVPPKPLFQDHSSSEGAAPSPRKSPTKQDRIARDAKKAFSQRKHDLAESFLVELDDAITDGQIAKLAAATGGVKIIWSKKLNTTAGRANWKRETIRSHTPGPDGRPAPTYRHHAAIELAEKVIDDEHRLLNVMAHEFCHLANFMISNIKTNPHGKEFKAWASKCSSHFGHRGIEVTTKHSYAIEYKYIWECTNCGILFKRHSKSIDPSRHQCGSCKSKLVQIKPVPRIVGSKISEYQNFVKNNMKKVREENPGSPQKEIMSLVGKKYQEFKASKMTNGMDDGQSFEGISVEEDASSKEGSPEDDGTSSIARKLNFLTLTDS